MKDGWQIKKIGDVCRLMTGGTPSRTKVEYFGGNIKWLVSGDIHQKEIFDCEGRITAVGMKGSNAKLLPQNSVMIALNGQGKTRGAVAILRATATCNQSLVSIYPNDPEKLLPEFLYANLHGRYQEIRQMTGDSGNDRRGLNMSLIKGIEIPIAPPDEQQRIVRILNEAFTGIATAKASAERNLQNACAIFQSHLQSTFSHRGDGWVEKSVGELVVEGTLVKPFDGNHGEIHPCKADYTESGIPFIMACDLQNGSVDTEHCTFISRKLADSLRVGFAKDGDVLISHKGTIGRSAIVNTEDDYIMLTPQITSYRVKDASKLFNRFIRYYFMSPIFQREMISGAADGSTRAYIGITKQLSLRFRFPSLAEQKKIAAEFDVLDLETNLLATIYERKLDALEALKLSLLRQAFTGKLTMPAPVPIPSPSPIQTPDISTTDLHAGILAMAYKLHEQSGKQNDFGHVKAEKIAHMVEASLAIDLGRSPVKDAAGPNDFPHLLKVEHRARKANYFDFKRSDGSAYRVQKFSGFQRLIEKTSSALGPKCEAVERLLRWMLPMSTQQAEIVATVFAAWNNLLLEGKLPTDEQIVFEARENWHPDKLQIERDKFLKAVEWLRAKDRIPEGKGKPVECKVR